MRVFRVFWISGNIITKRFGRKEKKMKKYFYGQKELSSARCDGKNFFRVAFSSLKRRLKNLTILRKFTLIYQTLKFKTLKNPKNR